MLFNDALKLLLEGKHVARASWSQEDGYLAFMEGMKHVWKIITTPTPNAGNHIFSVEELLANDWVIFGSQVEVEVAAPEANVE